MTALLDAQSPAQKLTLEHDVDIPVTDFEHRYDYLLLVGRVLKFKSFVCSQEI